MTRRDADPPTDKPPTDEEIEQLIARSQHLLDELHATFHEIRTLLVDTDQRPDT